MGFPGALRASADPMRTLRRALLGLLSLLLALTLGLAWAAWTALQDQPQVTRVAEVSVLDVTRAMRLLRTIDPRRQAGEGLHELALSQRELELLVDQVSQRTLQAATRVTLLPKSARVQASMPLQGLLAGHWLNIDARLNQSAALPMIESLRLGDLQLPGWAGAWALRWALAHQLGRDEIRLVREVLQAVAIAPDKLTLSYLWRAGTTDRVFAMLMPRPEQDRLRVYVERLAGLRLRAVAAGRIPLTQLLPPLFALAKARSAEGGDAAQEMRAAILALAFVPYPGQLLSVVPAARRWRLPPRWHLTLAGRDDFPLHFIISAALAVEGGGPLADAIGAFKELLDAGDGSGFSFSDIAADQAGRRFGQLALRAPERLHALAAGVSDADLLPEMSDLPEFMRPAEFNARYGGLGAPAYQQQLADIEARLDAMPLYRRAN